MRRVRMILMAMGLSMATLCLGHEPNVGADLQEKAEAALTRGGKYLLTLQNEDGSFGKYPHPAIAALAIMALHDTPGISKAEGESAIEKGLTYTLSFVQPDGSIYPAGRSMKESGNYPNYTTSIALLALATVNRPQDLETIRNARKYLQKMQFGDPDSVDYGGLGYGKTGRADLSNASWASEALHATDYLDREPFSKDPEAEKRTDEMWGKLQIFLTKCQNLPEVNTQPYVSQKPEDRGGFFYRPFESKAGSHDGETSDTNLVSSGSMTYAGLKSMLYAKLTPKDARVRGAMEYAMKNYTLDENPGMGMQGLYFYLLVMGKALDAYGRPVLVDAKGERHNWRQELTTKFLALQSEDGKWVNANGRFMEGLPELATAYSMMGLKVALGSPHTHGKGE